MIDKRKRLLAKAVSWKVIGITVLMAITYLFLGDLKVVTSLAVIYHFVQLGMFALHEKVWNRVKWGKTNGLFIQMTGMSGAGKSTLAQELSKRLKAKGYLVEVIDGDEYRQGISKDLGFSKEDRNTNIRRLGFVGKVLSRNNVVTIMAAINPYEDVRGELSEMGNFVKTVFVKCDLDTLKERDTKGLYRRALLPEGDPDRIPNFTGISDPFDNPTKPDLVIETAEETIEESVSKLEAFILRSV